MELYISDHPLDCLTCAANGDCELQDMAGVVGLRNVRYGVGETAVAGITGRHHLHLAHAKDESNPYFTYDPSKCIVLQPLRARLRGGAGHVRADDFGPRLRVACLARDGRAVHAERVRVLRRLCPGLPDRDADREDGDRTRPARTQRHHHLRLLRRRLQLQGGDEGLAGRAHGAVEGRPGQRRSQLHQGPLRLGLRDAQGPPDQADDPRQDHRPVARGELGRGAGAWLRASSAASRAPTAAIRSAASRRAAAPTRKPTSCRS